MLWPASASCWPSYSLCVWGKGRVKSRILGIALFFEAERVRKMRQIGKLLTCLVGYPECVSGRKGASQSDWRRPKGQPRSAEAASADYGYGNTERI
jgi:hypothetical protein